MLAGQAIDGAAGTGVESVGDEPHATANAAVTMAEQEARLSRLPRRGETRFISTTVYRQLLVAYGRRPTLSGSCDRTSVEPSLRHLISSEAPLPQVLDAIVQADRRYSWRVVNGVYVLRPDEAWSVPGGLLDEPVVHFSFDELTLQGAFAKLRAIW